MNTLYAFTRTREYSQVVHPPNIHLFGFIFSFQIQCFIFSIFVSFNNCHLLLLGDWTKKKNFASTDYTFLQIIAATKFFFFGYFSPRLKNLFSTATQKKKKFMQSEVFVPLRSFHYHFALSPQTRVCVCVCVRSHATYDEASIWSISEENWKIINNWIIPS